MVRRRKWKEESFLNRIRMNITPEVGLVPIENNRYLIENPDDEGVDDVIRIMRRPLAIYICPYKKRNMKYSRLFGKKFVEKYIRPRPYIVINGVEPLVTFDNELVDFVILEFVLKLNTFLCYNQILELIEKKVDSVESLNEILDSNLVFEKSVEVNDGGETTIKYRMNSRAFEIAEEDLDFRNNRHKENSNWKKEELLEGHDSTEDVYRIIKIRNIYPDRDEENSTNEDDRIVGNLNDSNVIENVETIDSEVEGIYMPNLIINDVGFNDIINVDDEFTTDSEESYDNIDTNSMWNPEAEY